MEADFVEVEVTSIPKASHRVIVGVKGATIKALRKEFKGCDIEVPDDKSKHAVILVSGPSGNVAKCIAKMEALVAAEGSATAAITAPAQTAGKAVSQQQHHQQPSSSSAATVVTTAPATTLLTFSFEKAAHAKLRGPRDVKRQEVEKLLRAALGAAGGASVTISRASLLFPNAADLTADTITVEAVMQKKDSNAAAAYGSTSSPSPSLVAAAIATIASFLKEHKLDHHVRDTAMKAAVAKATVATAPSVSGATTAEEDKVTTKAATASNETQPSAATEVTSAETSTAANTKSGGRSRGRRGGKGGKDAEDASGVGEQHVEAATAHPSSASGKPAGGYAAAAAAAPLYRKPINPFDSKAKGATKSGGGDPFELLAGLITADAPQRSLFAVKA